MALVSVFLLMFWFYEHEACNISGIWDNPTLPTQHFIVHEDSNSAVTASGPWAVDPVGKLAPNGTITLFFADSKGGVGVHAVGVVSQTDCSSIDWTDKPEKGMIWTRVGPVPTPKPSQPTPPPVPVPPTPQASLFCGNCADGGAPPLPLNKLVLSCGTKGATITSIDFASYGTPQGFDNICGKWSKGACDAANSSAIVKALCLGQPACTIYPNTTTFGDPCYGTVKQLVVEARCSGADVGQATCVTPTPAPPAPAPASAATVTVQWDTVIKTVSTHASLQVVSHRYLERASPIHNSSFEMLRDLKPHNARYVPWFTHEKAYSGCEFTAPTGVGTSQCKSSWNCTLADQMMGDFWNAVDGDNSEPIPNFSTQPSWM
jgi:hypothetical protein